MVANTAGATSRSSRCGRCPATTSSSRPSPRWWPTAPACSRRRPTPSWTPCRWAACRPTRDTQIATLAEYYLLADPTSTFLDPFGGYAPATSWDQHFFNAINYNVGKPAGPWSLFASGLDPNDNRFTYRVYQRQYSNALVLYKPLSSTPNGSAVGSTSNNTATWFPLNGRYRELQADGTLGPVVTSVTLRNGEGAILIKA